MNARSAPLPLPPVRRAAPARAGSAGARQRAHADRLRRQGLLRWALQLGTRLALVAMLALASLPTFSRLLAASSDAAPPAWSLLAGELCAATGEGGHTSAVPASDGSADPHSAPYSAADHLQHCAACVVAAQAGALPVSAYQFALVPADRQAPTALVDQAPASAHPPGLAQPRAPPLFS